MTSPAPTDFAGLLRRLVDADADFVLVGGLAGIVHGAARATFDVDVVYSRTRQNIDRLVQALQPITPTLRGAPAAVPFRFDAETVRAGLNFTLTTALGDIDLLGEIAGGGTFEALVANSVEVELFGFRCRSLTLEALIAAKRAAGRRKDLEAIAELEALLEERDRRSYERAR